MLYLSQRDPAWADRTFSKAKLTFGDYGCTLTGLSMLSSYFGCYHTPPEVADQVKFDNIGQIKWETLNLPCYSFVRRLRVRDDAAIAASVKDPSGACLVRVKIPKGYHWLVVLGKDLLGGWRVLDPWTGEKSSTRKYHDLVDGSAHFTRK